ncbi:hypothetical protein PHMEG_00016337 [Phytophthora megakarya]|uniref:Uncharacterized protein n=1 Tax=Phytophthora megakarya TaxID=4795 RepID=A0A225W1N7_9STRA|nr:hypothetical protein PHMEG_00016337 [Phytophthora megakarya]
MTALKQARDHPIFADHKSGSPPPSRDPSEKGSPKNSPPGTPPKDTPVKNTPKDPTPKGKPNKNTPKDSSLKGSGDKKRKTPPGATASALFPHPLVEKTKIKVKNDLEEIYRTAQEAKKSVYELAYPWEGSYLWYDPAAFPSLHLAHWRIWMRNRPKFFDWQLHAPLIGKYIMGVRRKAKMEAIQERVELLDMCVATWGYYGFLRMFESVPKKERKRLLMFWGGQPGRNSPDSRHYSGPTIANLSFMLKHDEKAYEQKIQNALEPFQIDKGAFTTITELLELTGALNPSAGIDSRLGDRALARVHLDVCSKKDPDHAHWVGDRLTGVWMTLIQCSRIKKLAVKVEKQLADGTYEIPEVDALQPHEEKYSGWTPFQRNGRYTAKAASNVLRQQLSAESDDDEGVSNAEEESSEEDEAESSRNKKKTKGAVLLPGEEEESDDDEVKPPAKRVKITAAKSKKP